MKKTSINLSDYATNGNYDFNTRMKGLAVRMKSNLGVLADEDDREITIVVPGEVFNVTAAFWQELLGNTIMDLGKATFNQRVKLQAKPAVELEVQRVIDEIDAMASK